MPTGAQSQSDKPGVLYSSHPSKRVNLDESTLMTVDLLLKKGVKKSGIIDHLMNHTDNNPTPKDVQNLVQKLKTREQRDGPSGTDKRLKKWMKQFGDVPGNVGRIFLGDVGDVGAKKGATCITLQAKHMRTLFDQFPEVLMIDTTHGTNRSKYKVFSFMAHDTFGMGQFVQHALLQNERYETLLDSDGESQSEQSCVDKTSMCAGGQGFH
ncbi:hypothetical protein F442_23221 [Phytophthora nicotianae P10297]|uniref:ZSWIM1/3 RNaseH-like domain-containing protein n=1 Tax=Phytophthora nicotianae P10297 TaxID=1317064 RepID=W2XXR1_PHYNI|nr:hypothetical protein F442_23221 [Phytophthora nicotianae P10297]